MHRTLLPWLVPLLLTTSILRAEPELTLIAQVSATAAGTQIDDYPVPPDLSGKEGIWLQRVTMLGRRDIVISAAPDGATLKMTWEDELPPEGQENTPRMKSFTAKLTRAEVDALWGVLTAQKAASLKGSDVIGSVVTDQPYYSFKMNRPGKTPLAGGFDVLGPALMKDPDSAGDAGIAARVRKALGGKPVPEYGRVIEAIEALAAGKRAR